MQVSPVSRSLYSQVIRVLQDDFGRPTTMRPDYSYGFIHSNILRRRVSGLGVVREKGKIIAVYSSGGYLFVCGHPEAAQVIYDKVRFTTWLNMVGDLELATEVYNFYTNRFFFKKTSRPRIHNVMHVTPETFRAVELEPPFVVRPANIGDVTNITLMTAKARAEEKVGPPMKLMEAHSFQQSLMSSIFIENVWVVQNAEGTAIATARVNQPQPATGATISNVFVEEEYRGRGIGKALVSHVVSAMFSLDITNCNLEVNEDNLPAERTYTSIGFATAKQFLVVLGN